MEFNEYAMEIHVRQRLAEARAGALRRREATRPILAPAVRQAIDAARAFYDRWSSAASAGSKPITSRAWSRSR